MERSMLVAGSAVLLLALGAPAAWAALGPSLSGETFSQDVPVEVTRTCDPNGSSTITFAAQGTALGPFPGTFAETGTLTLGPQNQPPLLPGSLFTGNAGQVMTFDAQFTIDSPAGQVTGHKTLVADPANQAACVVALSALADVGFGPQTCSDVDNATAFLPMLGYTASIQTASGTSQDSGGSTAEVSQFIASCQPLPGQFNQSSFQETFFATTPANTPGKATGGGIVYSPAPRITFGFNARSTGTSFSGHCNVVDHRTGARVRCLDVTSFVEVGNTATFSGNADVNGVATRYTVVVQDNSEPSRGTDTFTIQTDSGYAAGGPVTGGNIQVH